MQDTGLTAGGGKHRIRKRGMRQRSEKFASVAYAGMCVAERECQKGSESPSRTRHPQAKCPLTQEAYPMLECRQSDALDARSHPDRPYIPCHHRHYSLPLWIFTRHALRDFTAQLLKIATPAPIKTPALLPPVCAVASERMCYVLAKNNDT